MLQAFAKDSPLVITNGAIVKLPPSDENTEGQSFIVRLEANNVDEQKPEAQHTTRKHAYAVVSQNDISAITIEEGDQITIEVPELSPVVPLPTLGGVETFLEDGLGGLLIYGSHGSGKSTLAHALAQSLGLDVDTLARTVLVDCPKLTNERVAKVKEKLTDVFSEAVWNSPSVVIMDDLDRLIPAEEEQTPSAQSQQLAELIVDFIRKYCSRHNVMVIATIQQQTSVHKSIITSHVFGKLLHIMPPDRGQRAQILEATLVDHLEVDLTSRKAIDLSAVARTTEGYVAADLRILVERGVQEAALRRMRDVGGSTLELGDEGAKMVLDVRQDDFVKAQEGYVPTSLKGVKLQTSTVAWSDIGGLQETKRVLLETLEWPTKYAAIFANSPLRLRSGLLLYGYPGCGKTLLASAVAHECGLHFISVKGPELLNKYIGASEQSVRDLFERAQAARPCVLFFDEFDSIAPRRGHDNTGVTDRVVNQLLTQMDGAEALEGVYVLAATSRPDLIDPALLRPGRLDKSLLCDMPGVDERLEILQAVARKLDLDPTANLQKYATQTEGFTGADLRALVYNAHLDAVHEVIDVEGGMGKGKGKEKEANGSTGGLLEFVAVNGKGGGRMTSSERAKLTERLETIHDNTFNRKRISSTEDEKAISKPVSHRNRDALTHLMPGLKNSLK
ncbi:Peroxisome biosynthesis protein pex1 [Rhizophlyctis rosea]|uniref:Peroxisomal ATPase PEX1 n=1 Tax=Rhizophlyctis rosea TaxID=64517 RepID=A0AAD5X191_9FUNG|nr:Peroxisome biosynthesis protein pex1 [Rhizophlyctis rosea]